MTMTANKMIVSRGLEHDLPMMEKYIELTHPDIPAKRISFAEYLMHWNRAKEDGSLFKLFGDKLIISKQVTYERSESEMSREMDKSNFYYDCSDVRSVIYDIVGDVINFHVDNFSHREALKRYFGDCYSRDPYRHTYAERQANPDIATFYLVSSMLSESINDSRVWLRNEINDESYGAATLPGCSKKLLLPAGIKPVRAINRFIDFMRAYYKEVRNSDSVGMIDSLVAKLESLRQTVSMVTNQRKVTGKLSISIHPFDYMTMSEPENGWTSCMRWEDEDQGEYHAGTLEMMTSSSVIVAYLESKSNIHPAGMEETWNKKKWRELFVVDQMFINGIKGYPYKSTILENLVFEMLSDLAIKNWGVTFDTNNIMEVRDDGVCGMQLHTNFMYNDWAYNTSRAIVANGVDTDNLPSSYYYGGTCYCLVCGESRGSYEDNDDSAEMLWCDKCDGSEYCPICGRRSRSGLIEAPDGKHVCEYCLDNYQACVVCEKQLYCTEMYEFTIRYHRRGCWSRRWSFWVCSEHRREIQEKMCGMNWGDYNYQISRLNEDTLEWLKTHVEGFFYTFEGEDIIIEAEWEGSGEKPAMVEG